MISILIWLVCGISAYGFTFAYMQNEFTLTADYNRAGDRLFSLLLGVLGPIGLVAVIITKMYKHGLKFK